MVTTCFGVPVSRMSSSHAAGQETADRNPVGPLDRPDHGPAGPIWLGDESVVGDVDPLALEAHAIVTVLRFPIDIGDGRAVGIGAARPLAASQAIEPGFERRIGVTAVVACHCAPSENSDRAYQHNGGPQALHVTISNFHRKLQVSRRTEVTMRLPDADGMVAARSDGTHVLSTIRH